MPVKHYLVPDYVLGFECARCTECCKRWKIVIDKETLAKYEQIASEDEELAALLSGGLKRDKGGQASVRLQDRVAGLTLEEGGGEKEAAALDAAVCPFLGEDGLCLIQKKYGVGALSDTCKTFPRNICLTERGWEISLTYACKTASETLKDRNPVQFYQDPGGYGFPDLHGQYGRIGSLLDRKQAGKTNYFDVEELLIDIMQFREADIDTRLVLTGIVVNKLKDGDVSGVRKYLRNLDAGLISQLKAVPSQPAFMMKLVKEAVDKRLLVGGVSEKDMGRLLAAAYGRLKLLDGAAATEEKVRRFLDLCDRLYRPFTGDVGHVYENYFVNFIFSKKFYTYKYWDAFFLMVFFYALIRFFAVCACAAEERVVDEDALAEVISAVERSISHNKNYCDEVLRLVKEGDYHRLPYVVSLINL